MDRLLQTQFHGSLVRFGTFRCHPSNPTFADTGPIRSGHLIVFPRTSVRITHAGGKPIVADPNVVMFYNQGQVYRRAPISQQGDLCEWFSFCPLVIIDALHDYDPAASQRPDRPFSLTHGPSDATSYMAQRLAVEHFVGEGQPDHLQIEEMLLHVLVRVVQNAFEVRRGPSHATRADTRRAHADLVRATQEFIVAHFDQALSLERIATAVHSSPFRLCRLFRQQTGLTIHQYQNQLRLRGALERIPTYHGDLTALAFDLGYSSHSHFTSAFRRTFGIRPSQLASRPSSQQLRKLSKILIV